MTKYTTKIIGLAIVIQTALMIAAPQASLAQENLQIFGSEPSGHEQSEGRDLTACLQGWRQFIAAGIGYEDFSDYWRDFFLWPSHYADVAAVQDQLNKARYALMAAFLRCDLNRLKSVTDAYYRLEAELYFVRHYVDTDGGFLSVLTETPGKRKKFADEMLAYMILAKPAASQEETRTLYGNYFDLFEAKYKERAKQYASFGDDPVYQQLGAKFDEFLATIRSFEKMGDEIVALTNEAIIEPAQAVGKAVVNAYNHPLKSLGEAASAVAKRFDACAQTPDNRYCVTGESRTGSDYDDIFGGPFGTSGKITYDEARKAKSKRDAQLSEDLDRADMAARYELLYGQINGDGVHSIIEKMDSLLFTLEQGSLPKLDRIEQCASTVQGNVCK